MSSQTGRPLEGKLAVVTGAFRGIGSAITRHLASKGADVVGLYTSDSTTAAAQSTIKELASEYRVKIVAVKADLQKPEDAAIELINAVKSSFERHDSSLVVNIIVNNADVGGDYTLGEVPISEFHRIYGVNAVNPGPVEGDMYWEAGEVLWRQLDPFQQATPLSTVREGIDNPDLVKLANTKMGGRRPAYWTEIAGIVGMLCGEDSGWCTGSVVCANGGLRFSL